MRWTGGEKETIRDRKARFDPGKGGTAAIGFPLPEVWLGCLLSKAIDNGPWARLIRARGGRWSAGCSSCRHSH